MATGRRDDDAGLGRRVRADTVLPIVRAAMARGEGPPAVLAWVRRQGVTARRRGWTTADEVRARVLAARLAACLDRPAWAALETKHERAVTDTQGECPGPRP